MESKPILTKFIIDEQPYKIKPVNHHQTLKEIRKILFLHASILFESQGVTIEFEDESDVTLADICQDTKTVNLIPQVQSKINDNSINNSQVQNKPLENAISLKQNNGLDIYLYPDWLKIAKDKITEDAKAQGKSQKEIQELLTKVSPFSHIEEAKAKVIMVVGQTGSGKTTLLNFFINFLTGVQFSDNFRYILINEQTGISQALSQTSDVNVYYVKSHREGFPPIKVVDTPGFGDTRGIKQDQFITDQIRKFFVDHLESIDAICFVAQASNARLTSNQTYIFSQILEMYGKDVAENFVCMITFCDNDEPKVIEALNYPGDPKNLNQTGISMPSQKSIFCDLIPLIKEPWYLKFNSSALYLNNESAKNPINQIFWDIGMQSFDVFMKTKIQLLSRKSLVQTKEVLEERKKLEATIQALQPNITICLSMMNDKRNAQEQIKLNAGLIESSKNFLIESEVPKISEILLKPGEYVTNCIKCNFTCHYPCYIPDDGEKQGCSAIKGENCTCCSGNCHFSFHKNMSYRFEIKMEKKITEMSELKAKYSDANSKKSQQEQLMNGLDQELTNLAKICLKDQETIRKCINRLNEIALRTGCLESSDQYIEMMIISEESEKKPGFDGRIKVLKDLKTSGKYAKEAIKGDGVFMDLKAFI
ncbi:UNKNOWN [Stylonychia lemnae]|uniref:AIG1-type G domain-containing protein n=1 Tax=Stylonychia lemnae TaxID=5949 RepID=A0A078ANL3_STYLE|nr:UNKNOWN [Stylonychia lemnae]|eukprot:CDW82558.1 UNKNOWN [Stylonychia lemnae]